MVDQVLPRRWQLNVIIYFNSFLSTNGTKRNESTKQLWMKWSNWCCWWSEWSGIGWVGWPFIRRRRNNGQWVICLNSIQPHSTLLHFISSIVFINSISSCSIHFIHPLIFSISLLLNSLVEACCSSSLSLNSSNQRWRNESKRVEFDWVEFICGDGLWPITHRRRKKKSTPMNFFSKTRIDKLIEEINLLLWNESPKEKTNAMGM